MQSTRGADPATRSSPWLAVAGVCAVYVSFGLTIGVMAPMVDEISADLSLSRSTMGSILGAWALIYVFTAMPGGAIVDRLGLRWSVALGGLSIAISGLLRSQATGALSLFGAVAVFGIGGPLVSIATPKLVASLFEQDERRLPTGFGVSAPAMGSALGLALTNPVLLPLASDNWRGVMVIAASFAAAATGFWLYASRAVAHLPAGATRTDRATIARLAQLSSVRFILATSLFSFFFSHALNAWLPEILTDTGISENGAGYLAALSVTVGITGSLLISRLVPGSTRAATLTAIFVILAILAAGLTVVPLGLLVVLLAVVGFCRAGIIPLLFLELMDDPDIGVSDIGAVTGMFFAVGEIGGFAGPYAIGFVAERTDGFSAATALLSLVALAAAGGSLALARGRRTLLPVSP